MFKKFREIVDHYRDLPMTDERWKYVDAFAFGLGCGLVLMLYLVSS